MIAQAKPAPAPSCEECGAPLWEVNNRVVCSQHWDHYPQPGFSNGGIGRPVIPDAIPHVKAQKEKARSRALPAKHRQWFKRNLETEQYVTEEGGTTTTYTRLLVRPAPPKKKRRQAKPRKQPEPPTRAPLTDAYLEYRGLMMGMNIEPRTFEAWSEHYLEVQGRA